MLIWVLGRDGNADSAVSAKHRHLQCFAFLGENLVDVGRVFHLFVVDVRYNITRTETTAKHLHKNKCLQLQIVFRQFYKFHLRMRRRTQNNFPHQDTILNVIRNRVTSLSQLQ